MKMSIGFDVSKDTIDVALFDGEKLEHFKTENSESGFRVILKKIRSIENETVLVTMEATGIYHQRVADFFHSQGYAVSVVNPLSIKRYGDMKMLRGKTDKADSKLISDYGYFQKPHYYKPESENALRIKGLLKVISDLQLTKTQYKNRIEAVTHQSRPVEEVRNAYLNLISTTKVQIKQIEKEVYDLSIQEHEKEYHNLMSIPGMGKRATSAIIGYFGDMGSFETANQVASFIGISPCPKQSGTSVKGRGSISRKGNDYMRKLFYLAALSASRHNKTCVDLYQRLIGKGKSKKLALIAVANKLVHQVFAIVKYNRVYEPNFCPTR